MADLLNKLKKDYEEAYKNSSEYLKSKNFYLSDMWSVQADYAKELYDWVSERYPEIGVYP